MNFDFTEKFKNYSTVELLKIVKCPDKYQPAAVVAAAKILEGRVVTDADVEILENSLKEEEQQHKRRVEKMNQIQSKVADLIEPLVKPSETFSVSKWADILLIVLIVSTCLHLFDLVKSIVNYINCRSCRFDINIIQHLITFVYSFLAVIFLLKKSKWGWLLLFTDKLSSTIFGIGSFSFLLLTEKSFFIINIWGYLNLILGIGICIFLLKKPVREHFQVTDRLKKWGFYISLLILSIPLLVLLINLYLDAINF